MSIEKPLGKKNVTENWFTGDTEIAVADGRGYVPFKQLMEEGKDVEVYSEADNKVITIKTMSKVFGSAKKQMVYKITFTSGESIAVTQNNKLFLLSNEKVSVSELKKGQQLRVISRYKNSKGSGILNRDSKMFGSLPNFTVNSVKEIGEEYLYSAEVDIYNNFFIGNFKGKVEKHTRLGTSVKVSTCY